MASVRMSKDLRQRIYNKGQNLFSKPLERARDALAEDFPDRLMNEIYIQKLEQYVTVLPTAWCIKIEGMAGEIAGVYNSKEYKFNIHFDVIKKFKIPNVDQLITYGRRYAIGSYKPSQDLFDEYAKFQTRINKVDEEKAGFVTQLDNTLAKCNTLKQYLDAWPDGEHLTINQSVDKIQKLTGFDVERIKGTIIAWLEMEFIPEGLTQKQMEIYEKKIEAWIKDYLR